MEEAGEVTRRQVLKTLAGAAAAVLIGGAKPGEVKAEGQVDLGKQKKEGALPIKLPITRQEVKTLVSPERHSVLPKEINQDPFLRRFVVSEKEMYLLGRDTDKEGEPLFLCKYDSTIGYGQPIKVAETGTDFSDFVFADGVVYVGKQVEGQGKIEQYTFGQDNLFHKEEKEIMVEGVGQLKIIDRFIVAESQAGILLIDKNGLDEELLPDSQGAEVYVSQLDNILYLRKGNIIKTWQFNQAEKTPLAEIDLSGIPGEIVKIAAGENRGLAILAQEAETLTVYTKIYQRSSDSWATTGMTGIPTHEELSSQVNCRFIPICPFAQGTRQTALLVMEAYNNPNLPEAEPKIGYAIIFSDLNSSPFYVKVALPSFNGDPDVLANIRAAGISHLKVTQWPLVVAPEIDKFSQETELTLYNLAVPATTYTVALPFVGR